MIQSPTRYLSCWAICGLPTRSRSIKMKDIYCLQNHSLFVSANIICRDRKKDPWIILWMATLLQDVSCCWSQRDLSLFTCNERHLHIQSLFGLDFDGVDCSWRGRKEDSPFCYSVIPSYIVPAQQLLWKLPHPLDAIAKTIIMMLPRELLPKTKPYGGIMVVDPAKSGPTSVVKLLQDPRGQDIAHLTGVTVHDNKLYLGSLHNNFIGVYDLS